MPNGGSAGSRVAMVQLIIVPENGQQNARAACGAKLGFG